MFEPLYFADLHPEEIAESRLARAAEVAKCINNQGDECSFFRATSLRGIGNSLVHVRRMDLAGRDQECGYLEILVNGTLTDEFLLENFRAEIMEFLR